MADQIIIARSPATLAPCLMCGQLMPREQMAQERLCPKCWMTAGASMGWQAIPLHFQGLLAALEPHVGERGGEEDPLLCLLRVLAERRVLIDAEEGEDHDARCCYCRAEASTEPGPGGSVCSLQAMGVTGTLRLPSGIFSCRDRRACIGRVQAWMLGLAQPGGGVKQ